MNDSESLRASRVTVEKAMAGASYNDATKRIYIKF